MSNIWYWVCKPFSWLLRLFYSLTGSYGISLILFTLVIKLVLLPFQMKSKKSMVRLSRMNGKIQEIQTKYAKNNTKMQEELQKLYAEQGVNPMSGCGWSMLPMFLLIALYYVIREPIAYFMRFGTLAAGQEVVTAAKELIEKAGITLSSSTAYEQIEISNIINSQFPDFIAQHSGWVSVDYHFLGLDLSVIPTSALSMLKSGITWGAIGLLLIPIVSAGFQMLTMWITTRTQPKTDASNQTNRVMMLTMPLLSLWIGFTLPAALGVYWIVQSVLSALQEAVLGKFYTQRLESQENERQEKIEADRQRRQEEARIRQAEQKKLSAKQQAARKKKVEAERKKGRIVSTDAGRVEGRPYARGRAYRADRYDTPDDADAGQSC